MNILRSTSAYALGLISMVCVVGLWHNAPARAMGRTSAASDTTPTHGRSSEFQHGQGLFQDDAYDAAVGVFESLRYQQPDDPWVELYLRMSRQRVRQGNTLQSWKPTPERPAILSVLGLPPVVIRPSVKPPSMATPPTPTTVPAQTPPSGRVVAARPAPPAATDDVPVVREPDVPFPQDLSLPPSSSLVASPAGDVPVQAHADLIEFSPESKRVIGQGNVHVTHENMVLTCDRVIVFTESRDVLAEGHVRLEAPDGVLTGDTVYYNFATGKGTVLEGQGQFVPWYGRAPHLIKTSEHTLLMRDGYVTTCDLDDPHYRLQAKSATVHMDDKIVAKSVWFYIGKRRVWYLPRWSYSLRENRQKFSLFPGKKKPWGVFVLGKYRYEINKHAKGALHLDWRENFGLGTGIDHKYATRELGYGLFRAYWNPDADATKEESELLKGQDENRYRVLLRHRWDIDPSTNVIVDLQKESDIDFRRDFLFREDFQFDTKPESFALLTHTEPTHTFSTQLKKRMNRFQETSELLPEVKWDLLEQQVQDTDLYYLGQFTAGAYNKKRAHSGSDDDMVRVDFFHQFRYAMRWFRYVNMTPRFGMRHTYYSKDKQGGSARPDGERHFVRNAVEFGLDSSMKLFRTFDVDTDLFGMNIHALRHVITPTVRYAYAHDPTVPSSNLFQFDGIDSITRENRIVLGLENKLQSKQLIDQEVRKFDLARFVVSMPYTFKPEDGSHWETIAADLELQPHPRVRLESDITYSTMEDRFSTWNMDLIFGSDEFLPFRPLAVQEIREDEQTAVFEEQSRRWFVGIGHRYEHNARSEMTFEARWKPHPKWWVDFFTRYTYKEVVDDVKRINRNREYQIILTRDLHDWLLQLTVGEDRDLGGIFMLSLVLKAFPEMPVSLEDTYHQPKRGSQSGAFYRGTSSYSAP